jgi:hypothetical protein
VSSPSSCRSYCEVRRAAEDVSAADVAFQKCRIYRISAERRGARCRCGFPVMALSHSVRDSFGRVGRSRRTSSRRARGRPTAERVAGRPTRRRRRGAAAVRHSRCEGREMPQHAAISKLWPPQHGGGCSAGRAAFRRGRERYAAACWRRQEGEGAPAKRAAEAAQDGRGRGRRCR